MLFSGEDTDNTHSDDIGGYTPPKAPPKQDNGETISKPQANRIFALSGGNAGICKEVLKPSVMPSLMKYKRHTTKHMQGSTGSSKRTMKNKEFLANGRINPVPNPNPTTKSKGGRNVIPSLQQKIIAQYAESPYAHLHEIFLRHRRKATIYKVWSAKNT